MDMHDRLGRKLSQKRVDRRLYIMAETLRLIASKGYEGVTMTELARECDVSKKTLYDIYGSKEALVAAAVSSRMIEVSERIERDLKGQGFEKMLKLIRLTVASVLELPTLSRALGPLLIKDATRFGITAFFDKFHQAVLLEMAQDEMLQPWTDVEFTLRSLMLEQLSVQNLWASDNLPTRLYEGFALLSACRVLLPLASPKIQMDVTGHIRRLQSRLTFAF